MVKRFWIAWLASLAGIGAIWFWWWATHPASERSTGGGGLPRVGAVFIVLGLPALLSALRLSKIDDPGSAAHWLIPAFLALTVALFSLLVGYVPDNPGECSQLVSFDIDPSYCSTTLEVRMRAWVEATAFWFAFGGITFLVARVRAAKKQRTESVTA
jgi:hypothetical protein